MRKLTQIVNGAFSHPHPHKAPPEQTFMKNGRGNQNLMNKIRGRDHYTDDFSPTDWQTKIFVSQITKDHRVANNQVIGHLSLILGNFA